MADQPTNSLSDLHTIVVASDGSEYSEGAVREAIQLAGRCKATLVAVCVSEVGIGQLMYSDPEVVEQRDRAARGACESVKARAEESGIACEIAVHEADEPYQPIVAEAESRNAGAIVLGRRGRRGLMRILMGSATALTIGHSPCSVFVVPRDGRLSGQTLLVASDGSADSARAAQEAVHLAKRTGGRIIACSIVHGEIDAAAAQSHSGHIQDLAQAQGLKAEAVTAEGVPYEQISKLAVEHDVDLIVVGTHGSTGLKKLLMGSVAERVVGLAQCSVLVVK